MREQYVYLDSLFIYCIHLRAIQRESKQEFSSLFDIFPRTGWGEKVQHQWPVEGFHSFIQIFISDSSAGSMGRKILWENKHI